MAQIIIDGWTPKRQIQLRQTQNGKNYLNFQVGDRHRKYVGNGEYQDDGQTWYDVTLWGKTAETASKIVSPRTQLLVTGTVREREYEHQGEKRRKLEVIAANVGVVKTVEETSYDDPWQDGGSVYE